LECHLNFGTPDSAQQPVLNSWCFDVLGDLDRRGVMAGEARLVRRGWIFSDPAGLDQRGGSLPSNTE
jgi:hypothetical protein